jgi:DNA-binding transcriptional MerR regulator
MNENKNELSINVSGSSGVSIQDIHQVLNNSEKNELDKEIAEMLRLLQLPPAEKEQLTSKLVEAKQAIDTGKPKSVLSKILSEAGGFLKDFAKEAGKTAISALIKGNM